MSNILYHDEHIVVAVKPAGLLSESGKGGSFPSSLSEELQALTGKVHTLYTVHRLDRETEGIMVYALSSASAAKLSADITDGKWEKIYLARICGLLAKSEGKLCDLLYYDRVRSKSYVVKNKRKGVKEAILSYKVLSSDDNTSLVRVSLETGRTHQIRVQFASRGLPLCGDRRYGAPAESGNTLSLCACKLSFLHPKTGEALSFEILPTNF